MKAGDYFPWLAASFLAGMLAWATVADLDWSWALAGLRGYPPADGLFDSIIGGRPPGLPDAMLAAYLVAGGVWLASLAARPGSWLHRVQGTSGYLALVGWATLVTVLALRLAFARPGPHLVMGQGAAFVPWWRPGGGAEGWGTFPSLAVALLASGLAPLLAWGGPHRRETLLLPLLTLAPAAIWGAIGVLEQRLWASDAVAGSAVGVGWAWWLHWRVFGEGAQAAEAGRAAALRACGRSLALGAGALAAGWGARLLGAGRAPAGVAWLAAGVAGVVIFWFLRENNRHPGARPPRV